MSGFKQSFTKPSSFVQGAATSQTKLNVDITTSVEKHAQVHADPITEKLVLVCCGRGVNCIGGYLGCIVCDACRVTSMAATIESVVKAVPPPVIFTPQSSPESPRTIAITRPPSMTLTEACRTQPYRVEVYVSSDGTLYESRLTAAERAGKSWRATDVARYDAIRAEKEAKA